MPDLISVPDFRFMQRRFVLLMSSWFTAFFLNGEKRNVKTCTEG